MKTRWFQISALVLAIIILAVSVVKARAQEYDLDEIEVTNSAELMEGGEEKMRDGEAIIKEEAVNYYLPYPGLLPDHILYPVKMIRDKVAEWLTFDKVAKIRLLELYADKRIGAAKVLLEGGKTELGVETGLKAIAYQERAVTLMEEVKAAGREEGELMNQLERATAKHAEVWGGLVEVVPDQAKARMNEYKDKALQLNKRMQRVLGRE